MADFNSPIVVGMARTKPTERVRQRVLSDEEIRDLWAALSLMRGPTPFPGMVRVLLLSGQRRDEVAGMRWEEIHGDVWAVPPVRYKTGREHVVPLTPELKAIIGTKPNGAGPYVFTTTKGKRPFSGYGKAKDALDTAIAELRKKEKRDLMPAWVLHDLRRTARTLMSRAGVDPNVAEMVLGHVIPGVRGVYDRHSYLVEKRNALERLASLVNGILVPPSASVVGIKEQTQVIA